MDIHEKSSAVAEALGFQLKSSGLRWFLHVVKSSPAKPGDLLQYNES